MSTNTTTLQQGWNARIQQLQEYKNQHGDCLVPRTYKANPSLGRWVNKQRQMYRSSKNNSLSGKRISQLEKMGFVWVATKTRNKSNGAWWQRLEELRHYKQQHGHVHVPSNTSLGYWITAQRNQYNMQNNSTLSQKQVHALNELGFDWKHRREQVWQERVEELRQYKEIHGDCIVPITYKNKQLAHWVSNQRKYYNLNQEGKPSSLTSERIEELERMGFVWNRWDYEFEKKQERYFRQQRQLRIREESW